MSDGKKIASFAKGQAVHRPKGWIRSYRKIILHLVDGRMKPHEYAAYSILLHIAGWDKSKPNFGKVERNISRLQRDWFPFWSRANVIAVLRSLVEKRYINDDGEWYSIPNFGIYQSKDGVNKLTGGVNKLTVCVNRLTPSVNRLTPDAPQIRIVTISHKPKETLKNLIKKPHNPRKRGDDFFDQFWDRYPRKVGKVAAKKKFDKIAPDEEMLARMLEAIDEQSRSEQWTRDKGKFIPHPTTWLNQGRWDDEVNAPNESDDPYDTDIEVAINIWAYGKSKMAGETKSHDELIEIGWDLWKRGELPHDELFAS